MNAPYVDCSYKWGGGGILSTVGDLTTFGKALLYSFQSDENTDVTRDVLSSKPLEAAANGATGGSDENAETDEADPDKISGGEVEPAAPFQIYTDKPFLKAKTVKAMWTPVKGTKLSWDKDSHGGGYGMGWGVVPYHQRPGGVKDQRFYVSHTGGAIGASSVLLIMPLSEHDSDEAGIIKPLLATPKHELPRGIVVSIMCNLQGVNLNKAAHDVALELVDVVSTVRDLDNNGRRCCCSLCKQNLQDMREL